jgi:hypothetical protein
MGMGKKKVLSEFEKLLYEAINEREKRDPVKSISLFENVYEVAEMQNAVDQKLTVLNHLGLAFFHAAKSYETTDLSKLSEYMGSSYATFKNALDTAKYVESGLDLKDLEAVALRNLGRPEFAPFIPGGLKGCAVSALQALVLAKQCKRKDLVWFTHGVITARVALAKYKIEAVTTNDNKKLVRQEAWQWFWLTGGQPKLNRQVWLLGLLKDAAIIYPNLVTRKRLMKMFDFAQKNGLARRAEQIHKIILELYPPKPDVPVGQTA